MSKLVLTTQIQLSHPAARRQTGPSAQSGVSTRGERANPATGKRGSDVGNCRLNLAVLFDARTAGDYLVRYERAAGVRVDRRADLRALLCFDLRWQRFIPRQAAGRAPVDLAGMPGRVAGAIRGAMDGIG